MTERQKKILETVNKAIPLMTEMEQEKFLSFGEGLAYMAEQRKNAVSGVDA